MPTVPMHRLVRAASLLAAVVLSACASKPAQPPGPPPPSPLDGSAWMLVELNAQSPATESATATLRFSGGRVSGSDGCNRFVGLYHAEGPALRIGRDLAATRRACSDAVSAGAEAYSRTLGRTVKFRQERDALVLLDAHGAALARFAPQPAGLTGKTWRVFTFADGTQTGTLVRRASLVTVEFDADGRVRGFGGCSAYGGFWSLAGERLSVGPLQSASANCPDRADLKAQQNAVLQALTRASSIQHDGERFQLRDASGTVVASGTALPRIDAISRR
ncbi:MAG: META domain-containing protein [Burkholderiaceae bacterium]